MVLYDRILVPTDGSEGFGRVAEHAVHLAEVHGANVHVLHVINSTEFVGFTMEPSWEAFHEMLREDAAEAIADVKRVVVDAGIPVETHVVEGSPSREIVEFAEREGCDLVVMGTHGRGGLDRLLLGSVAERVVRASDVPVLTVSAVASGDGTDERERASREDRVDAVGEREPEGEPGVEAA